MRKVMDQTKLMRPYTNHLLQKTQEHYDIVIWSQTSWRALEAKLTELNILQSFKIAFVT
eukprot:UN20626